ncbi:hypothetical protein DFA_04000 [Cavenderia fasciculata]|uniref:NADPH-dependent FMN reductase-like domain-containing protein n=1 Tax=Cavenderia fasciculata TaxID=261658 RepID=F4Q105_CACFS|nr:uncharacterized protein DFA_04000 [Cavenderia fasciculata]EGG18506.1 hypothetical protein DFA_04000 [Cavenderia fasciculata]|eukprot:XP_004366410.1 hypothetical protein DFA_04000 [Cavenderia fasciculata]
MEPTTTTASSKKIAVIIGSVRTHRIGDTVANWFVQASGIESSFTVEIIDLKTWNLPLYDEAYPPMYLNGAYTTELAKQWRDKIAQFDGFVFVTCEYNSGYSPSIKNGIDYLFTEWNKKPALVVSYGFVGGASANNQLSHVLANSGLKMRLVQHKVELTLSRDMYGADGKLADINTSFAKFAPETVKAVAELLTIVNTPLEN